MQACLENEGEFTAYGILDAAVRGPMQALLWLRGVPPRLLCRDPVSHAIRVAGAVARGDARAFVGLYGDAPRMSPYLMDRLRDRLEMAAVRALVASHAGRMPLAFVGGALGLEEGEVEGVLTNKHRCAVTGGSVDVAATRSQWGWVKG